MSRIDAPESQFWAVGVCIMLLLWGKQALSAYTETENAAYQQNTDHLLI